MRTFLKLFANLYSWRIDRLERKIGYHFEFGKISDTWVNGWMRVDISNALVKHGIHAWCVDYFTVGALAPDGISSRYDRNAKQYQSWLGAYLVKFKENREFTIQDHFDLAIADQKNWLHDFGDPKPFCEILASTFKDKGPIQIGKYSGELYEEWSGPSHSDVGSKCDNVHNRILMSLMASMFDKSNPAINLSGKNFIPKDIHTEYETVILKGYIAIVSLEKNISLVLYGNSAALLDQNQEEVVDYTPLLKKDILEAFQEAVITKLK